MFLIHIGSITDQGLNLDQQEDATLLPLLNTVAGNGEVRFVRPVHVRIHANLSGESVLIDGFAESEIRIPCSRCLEPFDLKIGTYFSATAVPEIPSLIDPEPGDDIELAADEMDVITYSGDSIDLGDEISQQIIMALPFKPLCRDACKGLCSRCGVNLNQTPCRCHPLGEKSPFAVLKTHAFPKKRG
jgi:uncharacterized protein